MSLQRLIAIALKTSLALTVFSVGLGARPQDIAFLSRRPGLLFRSLLSMNVAMPVAALWFALVFPLEPPVKLALIALMIAPVPPLLPGKLARTGADSSYSIGLFALVSILSCVTVPLTLWIMGALFGVTLHVPVSVIAEIIVPGLLVPLLAGAGINHFWPSLSARLRRPASIVATIGLAVAVVPIMIKFFPRMLELTGGGTIAAIVALAVIGLVTGHLCGGPDADTRAVLAMASATRHPAVAIAVASALFPEEERVPAAVLLYHVVCAIITGPYQLRATRAIARQRGG